MKTIFLDHASATPLDERVAAVMLPYLSEKFHNPSALYGAAVEVRKDIDDARSAVAKILGARPAEIIFTSGGTESDNLAISGVMKKHPGARIVISATEHDSVLSTAGQYDCTVVPVSNDGIVSPESVIAAIDDNTVLVSVMYANNEIGAIQPIREIARLLQQVRAKRVEDRNMLPLYLHTDAAQAANYLDLQTARLGIDLMSINGGKIYGPKQSGVLYVRAGTKLLPQILGGGQERGMRSGTENPGAIVAFAAALGRAQEMRHTETRRLAELKQDFMNKITEAVPSVRINGSLKNRLPNNIHMTFPGLDSERLIYQLDEAGIMAAAGSACSASSETPSHVLEAIGLSVADARSSLRLTMGRSTTHGEMEHTLAVLISIARTKQ